MPEDEVIDGYRGALSPTILNRADRVIE